MVIVNYILLGLMVGLVSGSLGIGGGVLLIPILMWIGFHHREAIGTAIGVMALPVFLLPALRYYQDGNLNLQAVLCIAAGFVLGTPLGAEIVSNLPTHWLPVVRILFGLMLIYIGMRYVFALDNQAAAALLGLASVALSLAAFWSLRALGRHYPPRQLADEIPRFQKQGPDEPDYYI